MKTIDGSQGEGGGQVLRTSLSLAMCLQIPIRLKNIRAGRKKPGLMRQHLTCVRAAKEICKAKVVGDELGSQEVEFYPNAIQAGDYHFAIGTAGSTCLLFQTVLPALLQANEPSTLILEGGTHNDMAPSFDFIQQSFLPRIKQIGYRLNIELCEYGFYPNGGGKWVVNILPMSSLNPLLLVKREKIQKRLAVATSARIPQHICERELRQVQKKCHWQESELEKRLVEACGPGNILSLRLTTDPSSEVFEVVGKVGISAERVANLAIREMQRYLSSSVVIGEKLADQLLLPLALGSGGSFTTLRPTLHTLTNIKVIQSLMECGIEVKRIKDDEYKIIVRNE